MLKEKNVKDKQSFAKASDDVQVLKQKLATKKLAAAKR